MKGENKDKLAMRRATWFLLAIFLVLFGVTWYFMGPGKAYMAKPTPTLSDIPLFDFMIDHVTELQIKDDQNIIHFIRQEDDAWKISGSDTPIAEDRLKNGIIDLATANSYGVLDPAPEATAVGLNPPAYTIQIVLKDGRKIDIKVGAMTPIKNGYYVILDDGKMQVASRLNIEAAIGLLQEPPLAIPVTVPQTLESSSIP